MRVRLKERDITQSELARRTGYSRQVISHYANNRLQMSPAVMKTISYVLGCTMEDLYQWEWESLKKR
ncbi:helix-turn-helix transcriptional regulator [Paenibacillus turicensis]|uniref:helix-turn-helix transcriptional regulator n=1 Tax=Paenibacillus turicensis TaxID=160487 RepID=UPI001FD7C681|nr:helix-turn-helix transcriptional regulator [Paenibacillus turicensis]